MPFAGAFSRLPTSMTPRDERGATEAIALAEGAVARHVLLAVDGVEPGPTNVFGERVVVERGDDVGALLRRAAERTASGERVAVVAQASGLQAARRELAAIASARAGLVVHCIPERVEGSVPSPLGLGDLPWGMLVAVGAAESLDLSLVARRAAEDSGCPFLVVHEPSELAHRRRPEIPIAPTRELAESFLGGPRPPRAPEGTPRAVADRVPFALGSALRDLESLSTRRLDVIERAPAVEATLGLVGFGSAGEALIAEVPRLRAAGHDVVAVRVVAWRPFPGPRLVKALGRTVAVSVVDAIDRPLSGGGALAVELKAAFSDAITWAPGYPGIGRIPRIACGVCPPGQDLSPADVDALVDNMLADERGHRTFSLPTLRPAI
jgi:pyruvate-ferredoxin/flavodoxin oxidoreductase